MDVDYNGYYNNPTMQSVYDSDFTCSSSDALAPPTTDDDDEAYARWASWQTKSGGVREKLCIVRVGRY